MGKKTESNSKQAFVKDLGWGKHAVDSMLKLRPGTVNETNIPVHVNVGIRND